VDERKLVWMAVTTGATMLGGRAVRGGLNQAWRLATHEDPPEDPGSSDVPWAKAIMWTVATGVVIGLGQLLIRRGMDRGWERLMGERPPV
jgi:hypothetical protein